MADPKSTANRPLWLMAVSLAVIAVCLVILVSRMQKLAQPVTNHPTPARELKPGETETRHIPSFARPGRKIIHQQPAPASAAQSVAVPSESKTEDDAQPIVPVVATEAEQPVTPPAGLVPVSAPETNTGVITGRVFLQGKPPPETPIRLDAFCGRVHLKPATTHNYVVSPDGGLGNVFVYIKSGLQRKDFAVPVPAVMNEVGCEFVPSVIGVMSGQDLIITNSDAHLHDADAKVGKETFFNLPQRPGSFTQKRFSIREHPGPSDVPIRINCDLHLWMVAHVWVVDNPFFAVTDKDGNYTITNVPPGKYELAAVHVDSPTSWTEGSKKQLVAVTNGGTTKEDMVIVSRSRPGASLEVKNR